MIPQKEEIGPPLDQTNRCSFSLSLSLSSQLSYVCTVDAQAICMRIGTKEECYKYLLPTPAARILLCKCTGDYHLLCSRRSGLDAVLCFWLCFRFRKFWRIGYVQIDVSEVLQGSTQALLLMISHGRHGAIAMAASDGSVLKPYIAL